MSAVDEAGVVGEAAEVVADVCRRGSGLTGCLLTGDGCDSGLGAAVGGEGRSALGGNALSAAVGVGGTTWVEGTSFELTAGRAASFLSAPAGVDEVAFFDPQSFSSSPATFSPPGRSSTFLLGDTLTDEDDDDRSALQSRLPAPSPPGWGVAPSSGPRLSLRCHGPVETLFPIVDFIEPMRSSRIFSFFDSSSADWNRASNADTDPGERSTGRGIGRLRGMQQGQTLVYPSEQ